MIILLLSVNYKILVFFQANLSQLLLHDFFFALLNVILMTAFFFGNDHIITLYFFLHSLQEVDFKVFWNIKQRLVMD